MAMSLSHPGISCAPVLVVDLRTDLRRNRAYCFSSFSWKGLFDSIDFLDSACCWPDIAASDHAVQIFG